MPTVDRAEGEVGAPSQPGREFGSGAFLASLALAGSFAALGINSISISRIEGSDGAGLIALSTQFVFITTFVAGGGLRTSVTYRVGAHLWSPRSAIRGALVAVLCLGAVGAVLGLGTYALLHNSAMKDFNLVMAVSLMGALPFALAWWILPAIPLARERYETYALLTVAGPVCVLLICPALALIGGGARGVIGFGLGWGLGGTLGAAWAVVPARPPGARVGPEHSV